jgi:hypothetical protein
MPLDRHGSGHRMPRSPDIDLRPPGAAPRRRFFHPRSSAPGNLDEIRRGRTSPRLAKQKSARRPPSAVAPRADRPPLAARWSASRGCFATARAARERPGGGDARDDDSRVTHAIARGGHERDQIIGEGGRRPVARGVVDAKRNDHEIRRFRRNARHQPLQGAPDGCPRQAASTPNRRPPGVAGKGAGGHGGYRLVAARKTDARHRRFANPDHPDRIASTQHLSIMRRIRGGQPRHAPTRCRPLRPDQRQQRKRTGQAGDNRRARNLTWRGGSLAGAERTLGVQPSRNAKLLDVDAASGPPTHHTPISFSAPTRYANACLRTGVTAPYTTHMS